MNWAYSQVVCCDIDEMKSFVAITTFCVLAIGLCSAGLSGSGTTTRYWDCCKPACAWKENVDSGDPVTSCSADGVTAVNASVTSGCDTDGTAYVCNNQQPWAVNDTFAYGFVAGSFSGGVDTSQCCICLQLTFSGTLAGKTFVVQNVNTGSDLGTNQFDIQIPGGGVGIFTRGCSTQWDVATTGWGAQYGGVTSDSDCDDLPTELQSGCHFRFDWYENADNPDVTFEQITCPSELTSITGCSNDDALLE